MWGRLLWVSRADLWWGHKLLPIFAVFVATEVKLGLPVTRLWREGLELLVAMIAGASYVAIVNDATDRAADRIAGKVNALSRHGAPMIAAAIAAPCVVGIGFILLWRDDLFVDGIYLAAWLVFTAYSVPPLRLKTRGIAGALADASGAHMLPALVAIGLVYRAAGQPLDGAWALTAAAWSLSYGLRNILWHQLVDAEADRNSGANTFVVRHSVRAGRRLARYVVFPTECVALAVLLVSLGQPLPALGLVAYLALASRRRAVFGQQAVILEPSGPSWVVLAEYYTFFLPVSLVLASAAAYPVDLTVLPLMTVMFPTLTMTSLRDAATILGLTASSRRRELAD